MDNQNSNNQPNLGDQNGVNPFDQNSDAGQVFTPAPVQNVPNVQTPPQANTVTPSADMSNQPQPMANPSTSPTPNPSNPDMVNQTQNVTQAPEATLPTNPVASPVQTAQPTPSSTFVPPGVGTAPATNDPNLANNQIHYPSTIPTNIEAKDGFMSRIFDNKIFTIIFAVLAFGLVIGSYFGYSTFVADNRGDVLSSFFDLDGKISNLSSSLTNRAFNETSPSFTPTKENLSKDKAADDKLVEDIAKLQEQYANALNGYKRPGEFKDTANAYNEMQMQCVDLMSKFSNDSAKVGVHFRTIKEVEDEADAFVLSTLSQKQQLTKADWLKKSYGDIKNEVEKLEFETDQYKDFKAKFIADLERRQGVIDDEKANFTKNYYDGRQIALYNAMGIWEVGTDLSDTVLNDKDAACKGSTKDDMYDYYYDYDFGSEDSSLVDQLSPF